ncbi:MAG: folate family ECF transporter S component [Clostridiales bacterium]|nr:folate family ECF transporter S component [Candidatus Crickella equi]
MKAKKLTTEMIVVIAFMVALEIVLSKLVSVNISFLRIGFGFLPIAILAILYGPIWAGVGYAIGDIIGGFLFPTGAFFPGFTVTAALTGVLFGLVLYNKKITFVRALVVSALVCILCNLLLNTFWLTFILGKGFAVLLASRAIKEIVAIPVMAVLIVLIDKTVMKAIPQKAR